MLEFHGSFYLSYYLFATLHELWFYEQLRFNKLNTVSGDGATSMVMLRSMTSISTNACVR